MLKADEDSNKDGQAVLIIVMGTSGSGKSTLGSSLASSLGIPFIDGDDLHPLSNVEKMSKGQALNDRDREPWLKLIREKAWELNQSRKSQGGPNRDRDRDQDQGRNRGRNGDGANKLERESHGKKLAEVFETSHLEEPNSRDYHEEIDHEKARDELKDKALMNQVHEEFSSSSSSNPASSSATNSSDNPSNTFRKISKDKQNGCVIACSALKRSYRSLLRGEIDSLSSSSNTSSSSGNSAININNNNNESSSSRNTRNSNLNLRVIHLYLRLPPSLLFHRMNLRENHFMKSGMLKSQLETLEEPKEEMGDEKEENEKEKDVIVIEAVKGGEWKQDQDRDEMENGDGDGDRHGDGKEKSKEEMNREAERKCRELLGW